MRLRFAVIGCIAGLSALPAQAAPCGGDFGQFVQAMKAEAAAAGDSRAAIDRFFAGAALDQKVLRLDRSQGIFHKSFVEFSHALISQNRIDNAARFNRKYAAIFDRAERQFGVDRGILLAFLAFETDFGQVQGDFNTRDALVTLAWNCRRPEVFQPQVIAAIKLSEEGEFDPATTTGAWAGEIGQVQMLPNDILEARGGRRWRRQGVDEDLGARRDPVGGASHAIFRLAGACSRGCRR